MAMYKEITVAATAQVALGSGALVSLVLSS